MTPVDIILETRGLSKHFGGIVAVDGVDFAVRRGTVHALIGPNGAGKTTFFNLLTKFHAPTNGSVFYNGDEITSLKPAEISRRGLTRSFQISAVFAQLTALENVRIGLQRRRGASFDFWRSETVLSEYNDEAMKLLGEVGLAGHAGAKAAELPYGRKRALEIATTLALDPEMILLDEPTSGMTAEDVERIVELIGRVAVRRTVLMVEHNLSVVSRLSHRITVLARGRVLAEGSYDEMASDRRVVEAYLGAGHV